MRNLKTDKPIEGEKLLQTLERAGVLFHPGKSEGFLPINFNLDDKGQVIKGQFLYLGKSLNLCIAAQEDLRSVLPLDWKYDRD